MYKNSDHVQLQIESQNQEEIQDHVKKLYNPFHWITQGVQYFQLSWVI
jgi:hypothetical protein